MLGIIIWSDPEAHKAVIWCEDHGDLAFANGTDCLVGLAEMPGEGTLVHCVTEMRDTTRTCVRLVVLDHFAAPEIAEALRDEAAQTAA